MVDDNIAAIVESLKQQVLALTEVVTSEGLDIKTLQKETKNLSKAIKALEDLAFEKFALKTELNSEVGRLNSEIGDLFSKVDELLALEEEINQLKGRVVALETKLNSYPDMPEYDPTVAYYTLVFNSEGKPFWCKNYFA